MTFMHILFLTIGYVKYTYGQGESILEPPHFQGFPVYEKYSERIKKSFYYGNLPTSDRPSLPLTSVLVDKFGHFYSRDSLERLALRDVASICYESCVTPCSVIIALLYLDRLRIHNPEYLTSSSPSEVFVVAMMVASKYLYDDGEDDEVFNNKWATSAAMLLTDLNQAEKKFLQAIEWNLFVDMTQFLQGLICVEAQIARNEALARGFFVYSDIVAVCQVLPSFWNSLLNSIGSAFLVCVLGYTAIIALITTSGFQLTWRYHSQLEETVKQMTIAGEGPQMKPILECDTKREKSFVGNFSAESLEPQKFFFDNETEGHSPVKGRFPILQTFTTSFLLATSPSTNLLLEDSLHLNLWPARLSDALNVPTRGHEGGMTWARGRHEDGMTWERGRHEDGMTWERGRHEDGMTWERRRRRALKSAKRLKPRNDREIEDDIVESANLQLHLAENSLGHSISKSGSSKSDLYLRGNCFGTTVGISMGIATLNRNYCSVSQKSANGNYSKSFYTLGISENISININPNLHGNINQFTYWLWKYSSAHCMSCNHVDWQSDILTLFT